MSRMPVQTDVRLSDWCTLGVGGPARWFIQATSESDVLDALTRSREHNVDALVLGGGSNVVISDAGFHGLVIQIAIAGVDVHEIGPTVHFRAGAGEAWDPFVARTVAAGCAGLECLSGIPGLVGGTPIQNVGAYGQDVSGPIRSVRVIDRVTHEAKTMSAEECGFGYRTSRFKHADAGRFIVASVEFALHRGGTPTIAYADVVKHFEAHPTRTPTLDEVRRAILQIRGRKGMVIEPGNPANHSVGSFFVNPVIRGDHHDRLRRDLGSEAPPTHPAGEGRVKIPAAWLIEHAGFPRGQPHGRVSISPFQSQAIINLGGASAGEVLGLAAAVKRAVWKTFGIALVPEPVFIGFDADADARWLQDASPADPPA